MQKADDDRRHEIETVIVQIMKARMHLHHNSLIAECVGQLEARFLPNVQSIESLIDLDRAQEDQRVYVVT